MELLDRQQAEAAMDPISIFDIRLNNDATHIFTIINQFKHTTEKNKRSSELDDLPKEIKSIPCRRVYKLLPAESVNYQNWVHWDACELSFGGFWCFTKLQRSGEKVSRKTEDGQTWSSKTGRGPKNGYPEQILVDKLVISGRAFHMLELTLKEEKPAVALCKIWRTGNSTVVACPETPYANVFSPDASSSTPQQVLEDHGFIDEGITGMQIEQSQGQLEGIAQQHVTSSALSMSGYILVHDSNKGSIQSIGQDDNSTYQESISFLHNTKGSFGQIALLNGDEAHKIASVAQNLASCFRNALHRALGIVREPESSRPSTSNNAQLMEEEAIGNTANPDAVPPPQETATQDDLIVDSDLDLDQFDGFSMVDIKSYLDDMA